MALTKPSPLMLASPRGDCIFEYTSTSVCTLNRRNGKHLFINGQNEVIPSTAPTLANTDLASNDTTYYVYAYMNSGTMDLEASATAYATDSTYGHQIKSGDATRTLVGMVRKTSGNFVDNGDTRFVRSWYHDGGFALFKEPSAYGGTIAVAWGVLTNSSTIRVLVWAGESVQLAAVFAAYPNATATLISSVAIDGVAPYGTTGVSTVLNGEWGVAPSHYATAALSEGYHYFQIGVSSDGTTGWTTATYGGNTAQSNGRGN